MERNEGKGESRKEEEKGGKAARNHANKEVNQLGCGEKGPNDSKRGVMAGKRKQREGKQQHGT